MLKNDSGGWQPSPSATLRQLGPGTGRNAAEAGDIGRRGRTCQVIFSDKRACKETDGLRAAGGEGSGQRLGLLSGPGCRGASSGTSRSRGEPRWQVRRPSRRDRSRPVTDTATGAILCAPARVPRLQNANLTRQRRFLAASIIDDSRGFFGAAKLNIVGHNS